MSQYIDNSMLLESKMKIIKLSLVEVCAFSVIIICMKRGIISSNSDIGCCIHFHMYALEKGMNPSFLHPTLY